KELIYSSTSLSYSPLRYLFHSSLITLAITALQLSPEIFSPFPFIEEQAAHLTPNVESTTMDGSIPPLSIVDANLPNDSVFAAHPQDLYDCINNSTGLPAYLFTVI